MTFEVLSDYEQTLLSAWEESYKKGQLTQWVLLALKDGPKHMADIKKFIDWATNGTLSADDKSMYRALRRFYVAEIVTFETEKSVAGPDLKNYQLTTVGGRVLEAFLDRNVRTVFYKESIDKLINGETR